MQLHNRNEYKLAVNVCSERFSVVFGFSSIAVLTSNMNSEIYIHWVPQQLNSIFMSQLFSYLKAN